MQTPMSPSGPMTPFAAFAQIAASFSYACLNGARLMNDYQMIYGKAFKRTLDEEREEGIEATMGGGSKGTIAPNMVESMYNRWLKNSDDELEAELNSEHFTQLLVNYTKALVDLRSFMRKAGYPVSYLDRMFDFYVRSHMVFSLIPKEYHLAPFDVAHRKGKTRLIHYRSPERTGSTLAAHDTTSKVEGSSQISRKQPLLIIYPPINTFHILDLNPRRSVVRNLLASSDLDVYMLDWGYPDWNDDSLSLSDYLDYVIDAVKVIKSESGSAKVSILGYCWGGIVALLYTALFNDSVRNLALLAAPVDFSKDTTVLANWARTIDVDGLLDEFGHMDGQVLDLAFLMRDPSRYGFDKYMRFLHKLYDREFVDTFIDVERWLYDTPPIPGGLYRQIIDDCYRNNLLVLNQLEITTASDGKKHRIDLGKISVPLLTIVAEKDDLVSPEASISVNDHVSSKEKSVLQNPGGHVALCIGHTAHERLWPQVAKWITSE
jgi:polyhydroxyalkanoate synthase subunit PhaC